jgi:hypothetical protein
MWLEVLTVHLKKNWIGNGNKKAVIGENYLVPHKRVKGEVKQFLYRP